MRQLAGDTSCRVHARARTKLSLIATHSETAETKDETIDRSPTLGWGRLDPTPRAYGEESRRAMAVDGGSTEPQEVSLDPIPKWRVLSLF